MRRLAIFALMSVAAFAADPPVLIQNATILTVTNGTVKGSILLDGGKIAAIGERVATPAGAIIVDAANKYVMPGIIDCESHSMIDGGVKEGSVSVGGRAGVADGLDAQDIDI